VTFRYPEVSEIHKQINCEKIILDGELFIMNNGKPDFFEMRRRSLMSDKFKIELASKRLPITFTAYDILYKDGQELTNLSLMERKPILDESIEENSRISISRYIEIEGIKLFEMTKRNDLEGIVAKRKDSKYYFDKRTKDWIKIKNLEDDDFVVCGYTEKSIILGQYNDNKQLIYKGHVSLGISNSYFETIMKISRINESPFYLSPSNEDVIWIEQVLVCTVKYMEKSDKGFLRQPVFKGLRDDKAPMECKI